MLHVDTVCDDWLVTLVDEDGNEMPPVVIAYHSRALTSSEMKYSAQCGWLMMISFAA